MFPRHFMKRFLVPVFMLFAACAPLARSEQAVINSPARQALSLNGVWRVIVDPYDNGYFNYRLEP